VNEGLELMIQRKVLALCALSALACCGARPSAALAEECATTIDRRNVVRCALSASPSIQRERYGVDVFEARRRAVSPVLPANPELTFSAGHRRTSSAQATNWYATVSQEIEIAGQRAARRGAAGAAKSAQEQGLLATERSVASEAWRAYFEAVAARDALATAVRLEQTFARVSQAAQAAAGQGLLSGVDGDVAELTWIRSSRARIEAERRLQLTTAALASALGLDPVVARPSVEGQLEPLAHVAALRQEQLGAAVEHRPEIAQSELTQRTHDQTASALRRGRVPNLTVSIFAQRDGFDERVLGAGVSLPVPLPSPLGQTAAGEIAQSEALARQATATGDGLRRQVRLEVVAARQTFEAAKAQLTLFSEERLARAERALTSIAAELSAGRLAISSAAVAQQTAIEFLSAHIEARLALCLASVELARAAGLTLVEGDL
jgi:cobalt-zinc-cadmium efflux system outer membrane protein